MAKDKFLNKSGGNKESMKPSVGKETPSPDHDVTPGHYHEEPADMMGECGPGGGGWNMDKSPYPGKAEFPQTAVEPPVKKRNNG